MQYFDINTDFVFWGRDHVHGTHVFEAAIAAAKSWGGRRIEKLALTFRREIARQGRLILYPSKEALLAERDELAVEIGGTVDGESFFAGLMCDGGPIEVTTEDDEPSLVEGISLDGETKTIAMRYPGKERIFTRLVAMNKWLLNALLDADGFTPWRLARLALDAPETVWEEGFISVQLNNNVGNMMTRSKIAMGKKVIGEIQFVRRRR